MMFTLIGLVVATIFFFIKPHHLQKSKHINKPVSRMVIVMVALAVMLVTMFSFGTVMAATEPASVKQARLAQDTADAQAQQQAKSTADQQRRIEEDAKKPIAKIETKTEVVPFGSIEQQTDTLPSGKTKVSVVGADGTRTITYEVTYVQGKETARKETKNEITTQPVARVTLIGTYVAPPTAQTYTSPSTNTYTPPAQATSRIGATCNDGSHSNATGSGACSHHGGVAHWLYG
ncbi:MAG TPA: G5 domain-containing protein [Candidatus Chromulinivoraceae bacterium]|nr:G5 domain-containing protein [Candidatus Chromulinivoraceae bacterium]